MLLFGDLLSEHEYVGVDVSDSVAEAERNFPLSGIRGSFVQGNLASLPQSLGNFDLIFSEGVLHHTDSVSESLKYLSSRLNPGGRMAFYVYASKAPLRDSRDDMVRDAISGMTDEQAWKALMPLSMLGQALGDLGISIEIPEDVTVLGIEKGTYDIQRLFFYKFFYRPDYTLEEMNHINFDWFRPRNCWRHTPEEVLSFVEGAGLTTERVHVDESGITLIASRSPLTGANNVTQ